jgi:hypothetical protein
MLETEEVAQKGLNVENAVKQWLKEQEAGKLMQ